MKNGVACGSVARPCLRWLYVSTPTACFLTTLGSYVTEYTHLSKAQSHEQVIHTFVTISTVLEFGSLLLYAGSEVRVQKLDLKYKHCLP